MALLVLGIAASSLILAGIASNLIRLGPATVALPDPPMTLDATWYRIPDADPANDYYAFLVTVTNLVDRADILPFAISLNLTVIGGQAVTGWFPQAGDHARQESLTPEFIDSRPSVTLNQPAGYVNTYNGRSYFIWTVVGKRGVESQPIFVQSADFYLEGVVFPENATMEVHPEVLVTWYYANALQAYSVADRGAHVVCTYAPTAESEGTAPYSACA